MRTKITFLPVKYHLYSNFMKNSALLVMHVLEEWLPWCRKIVTISSYTGKKISTETCWVDNVFLPGDRWFGSDINTNCAVIYKLMERGVAYVGLPSYRALAVLCRILALITQYCVWETVYIFIHLPKMFLYTGIIFGQRIGHITMGLLYTRFTYYTKGNQQECPRLSNWFHCVFGTVDETLVWTPVKIGV